MNNTQQINDDEDDTSMYINLPAADELIEETASRPRQEPISSTAKINNPQSAAQQFDVSTHRPVSPTLQQDPGQGQSSNPPFNPISNDIKDQDSLQPTPNEVAVAVAAAAAAGHLPQVEEENNNNSVQQDANSAMVTAAAAAAAEVAAAAAADSSRESDSEDLGHQDKQSRISLKSSNSKRNKNSTNSSQPQSEISKDGYSKSSTSHNTFASTESDLNVSATKSESSITAHEKDEYPTSIDRPWPLDKSVSEAEYRHVPHILRENLVQSSEYANGLTYIAQIQPKTFSSKAEAVNFLKSFGYNEGFSVKKIESESTQLSLVYGCAVSHQEETKPNSLKRSSPSDEFKECPFRVTITCNPDTDLWTVDSTSPDHNHGPTGHAASAKKRRLTYFQRTLRDDFIPLKFPVPKKKSASNSSVASIFSNNNIYSEESPQTNPSKKVDNLRGLVGALRFDNAYVMDRLDKNGSVTHLFWTNQDCMDMLQLFPEVLFINVVRDSNTPPLVHILGITCFNTTFEVGYGYLKTYALEGLVWVMNSLKEIATKALQGENSYQPSAVIIQHDLQLMGAVELQFENTCQFCVSQLMRDVNEKAASHFSTPEERKRFIERFQTLVDSETADIYAFNEAGFKKEYQGTKILEYVTYHWLQQKTRFVRAWVDQHLHFNNYSMGKAEAAQETITGYAYECDGDVLKLYYRISGLLKRKKEAYDALLKQEQEKCPLKFFVPFFDDVRFQISTHALELIKEQHELWLEAQSNSEPLSRCTSMFTNTTGLPCKHTLARPVTMDDIHPHWWLYKEKHHRVPLSAHERKTIEISSKFERTLSLAKQHFFNMVSLDLREVMLSEVVKYFTSIGVSGIDEMSSSSPNNVSKSSSLLNPRATPPAMSPSAHHHMLSGSNSPIHTGGRVSTPTTNLHKNSVNGIMSPAHHGSVSTSMPNLVSQNGASGNGSIDGSPENSSLSLPNMSTSMYLNLRGSQEYSNGNIEGQSTVNASTSATNNSETMNSSNTTPGHSASQSTGVSHSNIRHQTRSTAEFNELAAAAAAAAEAENVSGNSGNGNPTAGNNSSAQYIKSGNNGGASNNSNNTYPASMANIMNNSNQSSQHHDSFYSKHGNHHSPSGNSPPLSMAHQSSQQTYHQTADQQLMRSGHQYSVQNPAAMVLSASSHLQNRDEVSAAHSILQVSSGTMPMPSPRKCGKCNQIGHNSRTCGQRISLEGL